MSEIIQFSVPGTPRSWKRPSGKHHRYTSPEEKAIREEIGLHARTAMRGKEMLIGPLFVSILAVFPNPKGGPRQDANFHSSRPDADNIAKLAIESIMGICFADDAQVSGLDILKIYGNDPQLRVLVRPASYDSVHWDKVGW